MGKGTGKGGCIPAWQEIRAWQQGEAPVLAGIAGFLELIFSFSFWV